MPDNFDRNNFWRKFFPRRPTGKRGRRILHALGQFYDAGFRNLRYTPEKSTSGFTPTDFGPVDELGFPLGPPPSGIFPEVQFLSNKRVAQRNQRLLSQAIDAQNNALFQQQGLAERFRPGAATQLLPFYSHQADAVGRILAAKQTQAPDLSFRFLEHARERASHKAKGLGTLGKVFGGLQAAASVVAAPFTGGASLAALPGALGQIAGSQGPGSGALGLSSLFRKGSASPSAPLQGPTGPTQFGQGSASISDIVGSAGSGVGNLGPNAAGLGAGPGGGGEVASAGYGSDLDFSGGFLNNIYGSGPSSGSASMADIFGSPHPGGGGAAGAPAGTTALPSGGGGGGVAPGGLATLAQTLASQAGAGPQGAPQTPSGAPAPGPAGAVDDGAGGALMAQGDMGAHAYNPQGSAAAAGPALGMSSQDLSHILMAEEDPHISQFTSTILELQDEIMGVGGMMRAPYGAPQAREGLPPPVPGLGSAPMTPGEGQNTEFFDKIRLLMGGGLMDPAVSGLGGVK